MSRFSCLSTSLACAAIKAQCVFPATGKSSVAELRHGEVDGITCCAPLESVKFCRSNTDGVILKK